MRLIVHNPTGRRVARGGLVFAPRVSREVIVGSTAYREIKGCRALRIMKSSTDDKTPLTASLPPAPEPDAAPSPARNMRAETAPPPREDTSPREDTPPPAPPVESVATVPPAAPGEEPRPETAQDDEPETTPAPAAKPQQTVFECPECGRKIKSKIGLLSHRRRHHPESGV